MKFPRHRFPIIFESQDGFLHGKELGRRIKSFASRNRIQASSTSFVIMLDKTFCNLARLGNNRTRSSDVLLVFLQHLSLLNQENENPFVCVFMSRAEPIENSFNNKCGLIDGEIAK